MRWITGFGHFWYDFIVGDSVVLALGGVLALVAAWALVQSGQRSVAELALPLMLVATLALSLQLARSDAKI